MLWQEVMVDHHLHLIAAPFTARKLASAANKPSAPSVYQFLKDLEAVRSDNEIVRLLYVAATRSQRQLHIIASMQPNKNGELKPAAKSLLKVLWPAVQDEFLQATPLQFNSSTEQMDISQFKPQLQRLHTEELSNILDAEVFASHGEQHLENLAQNQSLASLADYLKGVDLQRHCGTLAHKYMELFSLESQQTWRVERVQQCLPAMQKWLQQQGHSRTQAAQGALQVQAALNATLNSEAGQWALNNHKQAASELSLMQTQDLDVQNHIIDRTFIENGTRWILDYKLTNLDESVDFTEAAKQHRPQLERYAGLFVSEGLPVKKAVLFLSTGQLEVL